MNVTVTFRPSIRRIAADAGVSRTTVSRVLNGHAGEFSRETRDRVLKTMRELNYIPVPPPPSQTHHRPTHIIGLLFDGLDLDDFQVAPGYRGMRQAGEALGYDLLTLRRQMPPDWSEEREEIRFLDRRCDAFIFVVPINRYALMESLVRHGIPVVSCGEDEVPPGVGYVIDDNEMVMKQAVQHLAERGHRRIGHLGGWPERSYFRHRQIGFRNAMAEAGLDPDRACLMDGDDSLQPVAAMVRLAAQGEITAVACANDRGALALWEQAEAMGLRVPRDLSIVGIDNSPQGERRGLTSFRVDGEAMGRSLVEAAAAVVDGKPPYRKLVAYRMVSRESVAEPSASFT